MSTPSVIRFVAVILLFAIVPPSGAGPPSDTHLVVLNDAGIGGTRTDGQVVVRGSWGRTPGQFGKTDEASRPGPMDFAIRNNALYVLDPVNGRVQVFALDGHLLRVIPIGSETVDFLSVGADGRIVVLDAFVRREIRAFSADGDAVARAALPNSIGLPSAVMAHGASISIEERHDRVHELTLRQRAGDFEASIVRSFDGRPMPGDLDTMHAQMEGDRRVRIQMQSGEVLGDAFVIQYPSPIQSILALQADEARRVYVAAACRTKEGEWVSDIVLVVIERSGRIAGILRLPNSYVTDHYRKVFVTATGDIFQMQTTEDEVRFVRFANPAHAKGQIKP